jgi:hypothetical protein
MENIRRALGSAVARISDQNYEQTFACYRFWFDIGQTHHQIPSNLVLNTILDTRVTCSRTPTSKELIHPAALLIPRFSKDAESDQILAPHSSGLQNRLCKTILQDFFSSNAGFVWSTDVGKSSAGYFHANTNLIAHWANLGYVEETTIRNQILQSLISHPELYSHHADALIILFKVAGATFEAYAIPSVVDHCFELLKDYHSRDPVGWESTDARKARVEKGGLVKVCAAGGERRPLG